MKRAVAVIADDISGAAEVGAVAHGHGLRVEVHTDQFRGGDSDGVIVDTDSRWCDERTAAGRVANAVQTIWAENWCQIFKKVDSVLRGPVGAELAAMLRTLGCQQALLVPVNPAFGRIIRGGLYLIDGVPLDQTQFARDLEHPARSAKVVDLLDAPSDWPVRVLNASDSLPSRGIVIGQASSGADLMAWGQRVEPKIVVAGAAGFFSAVLGATGYQRVPVDSPSPPTSAARILFLSGSVSEQAQQNLNRIIKLGYSVWTMPSELEDEASIATSVRQWSAQILSVLNDQGRVLLTVDRRRLDETGAARHLTELLTETVAGVLQRTRVDHLVVEGGATASALVRRMGWTRMRVVGEWSSQFPGVVVLEVIGTTAPLLTVKPGSYPWPPVLLTASSA